jgi:hypothetical protein
MLVLQLKADGWRLSRHSLVKQRGQVLVSQK